ncbi:MULTISPECIES: hypothetical protein [Levilactobacillus]|uniref:Uncharacterized protein n=1 Tax=Levilactobacillus paucivorans TaxID=616990 RepID=A0A0R2L7T5_9LACO|nr:MULTISPECIES: hypothetical protein [Levilactobacillus]KRN97870.1 hypothetical protein IV54_GL001170 [Levilactobacillus paucivorans]
MTKTQPSIPPVPIKSQDLPTPPLALTNEARVTWAMEAFRTRLRDNNWCQEN